MPPVRSRSGRLRRSLPGEDSVGGILPLFFHAGSASGLFAPQRRRTSPAGSGFRRVRAGSVRQPALRAVRCRGGRGAEVRTGLRKNGEHSFVEAGSVGGIRISFSAPVYAASDYIGRRNGGKTVSGGKTHDFRQRTGSPSSGAEPVRVEHACRMPVQTDTPVFGIAAEAGFGCLAHFDATFRRIAGMTPSCLRVLAARPVPQPGN